MKTNSDASFPLAAARGSVQKTFVPSRILSGFTDHNHFTNLLVGDYLVVDALRAGATEIPALVTETADRRQVDLGGIGPFGVGYVMNLKRPPLIQDFYTDAAVVGKVRERRYGFMVNFDLKQLNIGV